MKPAFDGLAHVGEQVPAVGHLQGLGSAEAGAAGVFGRAISGQDPDAGPLLEPNGQRRRGTVREKVDDAVTVEVHHNRTVAAALPHGPIVDADVDGGGRLRHRRGFDQP